MNVVWFWVIALLLESFPRREAALETEVPSSITCIIAPLTCATPSRARASSTPRPWRMTLYPVRLLEPFQVKAPIRGLEKTRINEGKQTRSSNKEEKKRWTEGRARSVCQLKEKKLWRGDQVLKPWPSVYLCWACANNHTYILPLLCAHPFFSTGLITFWLQFRCSTLTKQYLIDTKPGLTIATKHQGSCFCWHCSRAPIEGNAAVDTATHNWGSLSCGTTSRALKCLSMIRKGRRSEGSGANAGGVRWRGTLDGNEAFAETADPSTTRGQ